MLRFMIWKKDCEEQTVAMPTIDIVNPQYNKPFTLERQLDHMMHLRNVEKDAASEADTIDRTKKAWFLTPTQLLIHMHS